VLQNLIVEIERRRLPLINPQLEPLEWKGETVDLEVNVYRVAGQTKKPLLRLQDLIDRLHRLSAGDLGTNCQMGGRKWR